MFSWIAQLFKWDLNGFVWISGRRDTAVGQWLMYFIQYLMQGMIKLVEIYLQAVGREELIKIFNSHLSENLYLEIYSMVKVNYNFI